MLRLNASAAIWALTASVLSSRGSGHCTSASGGAQPPDRALERALEPLAARLGGEHLADEDLGPALGRRDAEGPARLRLREPGQAEGDGERGRAAHEEKLLTILEPPA